MRSSYVPNTVSRRFGAENIKNVWRCRDSMRRIAKSKKTSRDDGIKLRWPRRVSRGRQRPRVAASRPPGAACGRVLAARGRVSTRSQGATTGGHTGYAANTRPRRGHTLPLAAAAAAKLALLGHRIKQFSIQHTTYFSHYTCVTWKICKISLCLALGLKEIENHSHIYIVARWQNLVCMCGYMHAGPS